MKYNTVVFDLDNTLWDFKKNSILAIEYIRKYYQKKYGVKIIKKDFRDVYEEKNEKLWDEYRKGERTSKSISFTRFMLVGDFLGLNIKKNEAIDIANMYLEELYKGTILIENAIEVLDYLSLKYKIGLITNGFKQGLVRLKRCGMDKYFAFILSSEEYGYPKPNKGIFIYTSKMLGAKPNECIYIGDNYEGDVIGAKNSGYGAIYFNPKEKDFSRYNEKPDFNISSLDEIIKIL